MANEPSMAQEVLCGQVAQECACIAPGQHDGAHRCKCGGSWEGSIDGPDFRVVRFPGFIGALFSGDRL